MEGREDLAIFGNTVPKLNISPQKREGNSVNNTRHFSPHEFSCCFFHLLLFSFWITQELLFLVIVLLLIVCQGRSGSALQNLSLAKEVINICTEPVSLSGVVNIILLWMDLLSWYKIADVLISQEDWLLATLLTKENVSMHIDSTFPFPVEPLKTNDFQLLNAALADVTIAYSNIDSKDCTSDAPWIYGALN